MGLPAVAALRFLLWKVEQYCRTLSETGRCQQGHPLGREERSGLLMFADECAALDKP